MSYQELDKQEVAARKILGTAAVFPARKVEISDFGDDQRDAYDDFKEARDDLEAQADKLKVANAAIIEGIKTISLSYEKSDFGLDPKKTDDAKKIGLAHKQFSAFFAEEIAGLQRQNKVFDEVENTLNF